MGSCSLGGFVVRFNDFDFLVLGQGVSDADEIIVAHVIPAGFFIGEIVASIHVNGIEEGLQIILSFHSQNLADLFDRKINSINRDWMGWFTIWESPRALIAQGLPWQIHWFINFSISKLSFHFVVGQIIGNWIF